MSVPTRYDLLHGVTRTRGDVQATANVIRWARELFGEVFAGGVTLRACELNWEDDAFLTALALSTVPYVSNEALCLATYIAEHQRRVIALSGQSAS